MKKFLSLILTITLLSTVLAGCGSTSTPAETPATDSESKDPYSYASLSCELPAHVEGAVFGGTAGDSIPVTVRFDSAWLTQGDSAVYNADLAAFAALACADTYFRTKDLDRGTQNRVLFDDADPEEYSPTDFLRRCGFTESEYIESYKAKEYTADTNDSATLTMGYLAADGKDVYVLALRGCFSAQEWLSVFDPGCDDEIYASLTGEHAEWTHRGCFKGLDIAANRAMEFLQDFRTAHGTADAPDCILVTGHSRGGSLANLVAGRLAEEDDADVFAYTFNAHAVTTDSTAADVPGIFNLYDAADFYTGVLPFPQEEFYRYGTSIACPLSTDDNALAALAELCGREDYASLDSAVMENYRALFGGLFPDRASLYTPRTLTLTYPTPDEAAAARKELLTLLGADGLALEPFAVCSEPVANAAGGGELTLTYCGAALLWSYAKTLAYGEGAYRAVTTLFAADAEACAIADLLYENLAEISAGHTLVNSYILTQFAASEGVLPQ